MRLDLISKWATARLFLWGGRFSLFFNGGIGAEIIFLFITVYPTLSLKEDRATHSVAKEMQRAQI